MFGATFSVYLEYLSEKMVVGLNPDTLTIFTH